MGANGSTASGVVRIGDWEHRLCWMDAEEYYKRRASVSVADEPPSLSSSELVRRHISRSSTTVSSSCLGSFRRRRRKGSDASDLIEMSSIGDGGGRWNRAMDYSRGEETAVGAL